MTLGVRIPPLPLKLSFGLMAGQVVLVHLVEVRILQGQQYTDVAQW